MAAAVTNHERETRCVRPFATVALRLTVVVTPVLLLIAAVCSIVQRVAWPAGTLNVIVWVIVLTSLATRVLRFGEPAASPATLPSVINLVLLSSSESASSIGTRCSVRRQRQVTARSCREEGQTDQAEPRLTSTSTPGTSHTGQADASQNFEAHQGPRARRAGRWGQQAQYRPCALDAVPLEPRCGPSSTKGQSNR